MKTIQIPIYRKVNNLADTLNKEVTRAHTDIVHSVVLVESKSYAFKNLPAPDELSLLPFLSSIRGKYDALKKNIAVKLKGGYQKFAGAISVATYGEKLTALKESIKKEHDNYNNLVSDKNRVATKNRHTGYKKVKWLLPLFGIAESLLTVSCFLKIGDIMLIAIIVGSTIGLAQIYAAKTTVLAIREIDDTPRRRRYYLIAAIIFTVLSIVLGLVRYYFSSQSSVTAIPLLFLNPFTFAACNMLLVLASALIVYYYYPTKTEATELEQLQQIERQIKESEIRQKTLQTEYDTLFAERAAVTSLHGQVMHDEQKLFEKIDSFYQEAVGIFKNENICKRTDGMFPTCFKNPHEPLPNTTINNLQITA